MLCTPMFQRFTLFLVECVLGGSWNVLGGAQTQKMMCTMCFSVLGSVFTRRNAASGVSLGDSLGDPVGDLGPHMLCTHMFQRFASFSAECVFGGSLGRTWGCLWSPEGFLVSPRASGLLGDPWRRGMRQGAGSVILKLYSKSNLTRLSPCLWQWAADSFALRIPPGLASL